MPDQAERPTTTAAQPMRDFARPAVSVWSLMPDEDEHFPWHYTELGVVCACGRSMVNEVCPDA